jgi:hypothetical protein
VCRCHDCCEVYRGGGVEHHLGVLAGRVQPGEIAVGAKAGVVHQQIDGNTVPARG